MVKIPLLPFTAPDQPLFRVARAPDPWKAPDWAYANEDRTFGNRFDDSEGYFRVLYAGSTRLICFVETLARFRNHRRLEPLSGELTDVHNPADHTPLGTVPGSWLPKRRIGSANVVGKRFATVYSSAWLSWIRSTFEQRTDLVPQTGAELDLAVLLGQNRVLTQQLSSTVYAMGYDGIAYESRHGSDYYNWAIFEPFELTDQQASELNAADPDFREAMALLNLQFDENL